MKKDNKKIGLTYFEKHSKLLNREIRKYETARLKQEDDLFGTSDYAIFNNIESGITKHPLRYYQMEALYILDYLYKCNENKQEKKDLIEIFDKEKKIRVPFLSYEMATGSGKTMLMGACIYLLNQKYGIKNFLIITPASTDIYKKTIRNFDIGNFESIWADDTPFSFNLITGDNYTQNLFFDETKQSNIFIFNISKFGTNASNTEKTWENAIWTDENGNSTSIKEFLKNKELIIITDEAHHQQSSAAKKIIHHFLPNATIEFTATAIEESKGQDRKNQTIVYKYDIKRFLEDGHGKLVRAVALASSNKVVGDGEEILQNEKFKIITLFLIHLLKREAVKLDKKNDNIKPVAFIKVKDDTSYTKKVYAYIRRELSADIENINIILDKIKKQELEITDLIEGLYQSKYNNDIIKLRQDIQQVADTSIFYYGNSDKETEKQFLNIRDNNVEVVVYMQRLDEGIDLPNIYSMAVINDKSTDFKTSVKQIIGRGVRLNKDTREFDQEIDQFKATSEKLHIVCDQGKNFEEVIVAIQKEFGLNNKYLAFDKEKKSIQNKSKSELLENKRIPKIRADFKRKPNANLVEIISNVEKVVYGFIEDNCFEGQNDDKKRYLKYRPDKFFVEVDVFADKTVYHEQIQKGGGVSSKLNIDENLTKAIYGRLLKNLPCLPDTETSKIAFYKYMDELNKIGLMYYKINPSDEIISKNLFRDVFCNYYRNKIEKEYFDLDFKSIQTEDSFYLPTYFKDYELKIPDDQIKNNFKIILEDKKKSLSLIEAQAHFYGFEKSIYDYDKFDSYTEFHFASYLDVILKRVKDEKKPFWVRNQRNIYFEYGTRRYYPDFILFKDGQMYIVETKGEIFADHKKNKLLKRLEEVPGDEFIEGYKGLLIFSNQMEKMGYDYWDFEKFVRFAENSFDNYQTKEKLFDDVKDEEKYVNYLPVYTPQNAYKLFIKKQLKTKMEGWKEVAAKEKKYSKTYFITQVKGNALSPDYQKDDWIVLNYRSHIEKTDNYYCLIFNQNINDCYEQGYIISKILVKQFTPEGTLFPITEVQLVNSNGEDNKIICNDIKDIDIIGLSE